MSDLSRTTARVTLGYFDRIGADPDHPGSTRSIVLYFLDSDGARLPWGLGGIISTRDGAAFEPHSHDVEVSITFWEREAEQVVRPGAEFGLWYGSNIGFGTVVEPLTIDRRNA